jgi:integrase
MGPCWGAPEELGFRLVGRGRRGCLESGTDIRTIQELLGHRSVATTMICTHVLNRGAFGVRSPLEALFDRRDIG